MFLCCHILFFQLPMYAPVCAVIETQSRVDPVFYGKLVYVMVSHPQSCEIGCCLLGLGDSSWFLFGLDSARVREPSTIIRMPYFPFEVLPRLPWSCASLPHVRQISVTCRLQQAAPADWAASSNRGCTSPNGTSKRSAIFVAPNSSTVRADSWII